MGEGGSLSEQMRHADRMGGRSTQTGRAGETCRQDGWGRHTRWVGEAYIQDG